MGPKGEVNLAHPQLRWRLKKFPHPTGRIGGCLLVVFQPVTKYVPAGLELRVVEIDRNPEYRDADEPHGGGRNQQHSGLDRKSTRLNSSHLGISYAVFCLKKKKNDVLERQPDL